MNREDLEALRAKVSCEAVLEQAGYQLDAKESTRRAIKYRHGGNIIIVTHEGRGWFDPLGDEKGDVFALAMFLNRSSFLPAAEAVASLIGFRLSRPEWKCQRTSGPVEDVVERWRNRRTPSPGTSAWRYLCWERSIPSVIVRQAIGEGVLREGPFGSMWAAHLDSHSRVVGWEERGPEWRGFSTGGSKVLFCLGPGDASRLCVYAQPEAAFKAANVDAMLGDPAIAAKTLSRLTAEPEAFGSLKGNTGVFASRADKSDRDRALKNVTPLADSISDYLRQRGDAERRNDVEELAVRRQVALEIPALSSNAKSVLERVRDAIDRNDLPSGLEYALADKMVKAELEGFAKAVTERFGERTFLPLAAKDANGEAFQRVTSGMNAAQQSEVQQAWMTMRTVQQLSAHERSVTALKQAETLRQTKSQGLTLK